MLFCDALLEKIDQTRQGIGINKLTVGVLKHLLRLEHLPDRRVLNRPETARAIGPSAERRFEFLTYRECVVMLQAFALGNLCTGNTSRERS